MDTVEIEYRVYSVNVTIPIRDLMEAKDNIESLCFLVDEAVDSAGYKELLAVYPNYEDAETYCNGIGWYTTHLGCDDYAVFHTLEIITFAINPDGTERPEDETLFFDDYCIEVK